jgi:hypothetical protein
VRGGDQLAGQPHRVAADVVQRAAGQVAAQPDVLRAGQLEVEVRLDLAQLPDRAVRQHVAQLAHLGLEREHERFPEQRPGLLGHGEHLPGLGQRPAQRLLAEHRPARAQRLDRPLGVQAVGQRQVDRVHPGVVDERLVAPDRPADALGGRVLPGPGQIPAGHHGRDPVCLPQCGQELLARDAGRAHDSPAKLTRPWHLFTVDRVAASRLGLSSHVA